MPPQPGRKEETRRVMLAAIGRGFRREGYAASGVDALAREANVTSGAFYAHFGSKIGAFEAALSTGLDEVVEKLSALQEQHGAKWVEAFAEYYLSREHRADLACGCAMAALTQDVARSEPNLHALYERKMLKIARLAADGLSGGTEDDRTARAWSMLSALIGGVNVARAMNAPKVAAAVAQAARSTAVKAAGRARNVAR